jgi:hypothetical protein
VAALFPRWSNTAARAVLLAAVCTLGGVPVALMAWARTPNATGRYAPVRQPVPFDHRLHAARFAIGCQYCHASAAHSAAAGMPSTATCVPCHNAVWMASNELAPVRQSLSTGRPIEWNKVDRLPGFVYFDHAIHVRKGVSCATCHGNVERMSQVIQMEPMTMQWCVNCHREAPARYGARALTTCTTCHR